MSKFAAFIFVSAALGGVFRMQSSPTSGVTKELEKIVVTGPRQQNPPPCPPVCPPGGGPLPDSSTTKLPPRR